MVLHQEKLRVGPGMVASKLTDWECKWNGELQVSKVVKKGTESIN